MIYTEFSDVFYENTKEKHENEHICGMRLCTKMLKKYFNITEPVIKRTENGKPYIDAENVFFSISHTKNRVYCAVSDKNIGIDAEYITERDDKKIRSFAKRFFVENEIKELEKDDFSVTSFLSVWTKKEACLKLCGVTLAQIAKIDSTASNVHTYIDGNYIVSIATE